MGDVSLLFFCRFSLNLSLSSDVLCSRYLPFSHPRFTYTIPELTLVPR